MPKVSPGFDVLREVLTSPNELDRNLESANVVDGLFAIARALDRCAESLDRVASSTAATKEQVEAITKEVRSGFDGLCGL